MSFREWSAVKRAKRSKNFYHEWKITRAFPTTHASTYFFVNQQLSLSRTPRDPRHWSVTNLHKLSDQYHWALWNTHYIKLTFVTPIDKLSSFLLIFELFSLIFYWKYSIFLHDRDTPYMKYDVTHILTSLKNDVKGTEKNILKYEKMKIKDTNIFNTVGVYLKKNQWLNP